MSCFKHFFKKVVILIALGLLFLQSNGQAQQKLLVQIVRVDSVSWQYLVKKPDQFKAGDSLSVLKKLRKFNDNCINEGYLSSNFDSIVFDSVSVKAFLYLGKKYSFENLKVKNFPENVLSELRLTKKIAQNKPN